MSESQSPSPQGIPGFLLKEVGFTGFGFRVFSPEGKSLGIFERADPWHRVGAWPEGARLITFVISGKGERLPFGLWTWQSGKLVADPEPWFAPRCRIFPDYGGGYLWGPCGASDLCEGYTEDIQAAERLDRDFDAWESLWEIIDLEDFDAGAAPAGGWEAFDTRGLELCCHLMTLMGPEGLVVYQRNFFQSVPRMEPLLLYWEEVKEWKARAYDPVRYLDGEAAITAYLGAALEDGHPALIALAQKNAERARKRLDAYRVNLPEEDAEVEQLYFERFGSIPVGLWHGEEARRQALEQARLVLAGKRGPMHSEEFPLDCPPDAIL